MANHVKYKNNIILNSVLLLCNSVLAVDSFSNEFDPIKLLDQKLYSQLMNPTIEDRDLILRELVTYYFFICDLLVLVKIEHRTVKSVLGRIIKEGGPYILKVKINKTLMIEKCGWDKDMIRKLMMLLQDINQVWKRINKLKPKI